MSSLPFFLCWRITKNVSTFPTKDGLNITSIIKQLLSILFQCIISYPESIHSLLGMMHQSIAIPFKKHLKTSNTCTIIDGSIPTTHVASFLDMIFIRVKVRVNLSNPHSRSVFLQNSSHNMPILAIYIHTCQIWLFGNIKSLKNFIYFLLSYEFLVQVYFWS